VATASWIAACAGLAAATLAGITVFLQLKARRLTFDLKKGGWSGATGRISFPVGIINTSQVTIPRLALRIEAGGTVVAEQSYGAVVPGGHADFNFDLPRPNEVELERGNKPPRFKRGDAFLVVRAGSSRPKRFPFP
jgi:hypothetical protein